MKKLLISAIIALLPISAMSATVLGFQAGAGSWKHDPSGTINTDVDAATNTVDLKNDLNLKEESEGYAYFIIEHPVPLVPNFKYVNTKLTSAGTGAVNFTFDGVNYSTAVNTKIDLTHSDFIFYYEILDNVVSFDLGLNAKKIDGDITIDTDITTFSGTVPMLYVAAEIQLPAGFALAAEISTISSGGNEVTDLTTKVTYTTDFLLGVEAGVRNLSIEVDDADSVNGDVEFKGVFAGIYFKF